MSTSTSHLSAWQVCCVLVALLAVLAFTPLVIPPGRSSPMLLGIPLTLWTGMLIAFALVGLTFIGTKVQPETTSASEDKG